MMILLSVLVSTAKISVLNEPVLASVVLNSISIPISSPKIVKFSSLANHLVKLASCGQIDLKSLTYSNLPKCI